MRPARCSARVAAFALALAWVTLALPLGAQVCGDCTASGTVDILDALRAAQIDAGILPAGGICGAQFTACNVSGILCPSALARITILDALVIAQAAAGLIPLPLPCGAAVADEVRATTTSAAPTLSSIATTPATAGSAWSLDLSDAGGDGLPAHLERLVIERAGGDTTGGWIGVIAAARLFAGGVAAGPATVEDSRLVFDALAIDVPDGGTVPLEVRLEFDGRPRALEGHDGATLELGLVPGGLGTRGDGSAPDGLHAPQLTGAGNLVLTIVATRLGFRVEPAAITAPGSSCGPVEVRAVDENDNTDVDHVGTVTLAPAGASGTLSSTDPGGLVKVAVAGVVGWSDLRFDSEGVLAISATDSLAMLAGRSRGIAFTLAPRITSVVPSTGPAGGGNAITISGLGLVDGASVTIDGVPAVDVQYLGAGLVTCLAPPALPGAAGGAVDVEVGALLAPAAYTYAFDARAPGIITTLPRAGQGTFAATTRIAFLLDESIDPASVTSPTASATGSTILVQGGVVPGAAWVSENRRWIVLSRTLPWSNGVQVSAGLMAAPPGSAVVDVAGNPVRATGMIAGRSGAVMATASTPVVTSDTTPPQLVATVPAADQAGVRRGAPLPLIFNEPIDPSSLRISAGGPVSGATVELHELVSGMTVPLAIDVDADARHARLTPLVELAPGVVHELIVRGAGAGRSITDLAGNALGLARVEFTTADDAAFTVARCQPSSGDLAGGYPVRVEGDGFAPGARVRFGGALAAVVVRRSRSELEVLAPAATTPGSVEVSVENQDGSLATRAAAFTYAATQPADPFRPELIYEHPAANAAGTLAAFRNTRIALVMSEPLATDPEALGIGSGESIELELLGGVAVQLVSDPRIVVLVPSASFAAGPRMFLAPWRTADPLHGVRDPAGNRLLPVHPDASFGLTPSSEPCLGLSWSDGGVDAASPAIVAMAPPAASTTGAFTDIVLTLTERMDPSSVEAGFTVSDAAGAVPGRLSFDVATLRTFTFHPGRGLVGAVAVDATQVTDLAGNPLGGAPIVFNVVADATPPTIARLTLDDLPAYINGDASHGGGSSIGGRLRMPPSGFTIDIEVRDAGGEVALPPAPGWLLAASVSVGGHPPGTDLLPFLPPGSIGIRGDVISLLIPEALSFPAGTSDANAVAASLTVIAADVAGNASAPAVFAFDCVAAQPEHLPLDGGERFALALDRDHETTIVDLGGYALIAPGGDGCGGGDGTIDFEADLEIQGFLSHPPRVPSGHDLVASGATTINAAATTWIANRIRFHALRLLGSSLPWSDGTTNPGFAAPLVSPSIGDGLAAALDVFIAAAPIDPATSRIGLGGFKGPGIAGFGLFDSRNMQRGEDLGETCQAANLGVFSLIDAFVELDGTPSSPGSIYRQLYDAVMPAVGGAPGIPVGADVEDPFVFDPASDPLTFVGARAARYRAVLASMDAFAARQAMIAVHEIGHAVGLIEDGDPGRGLYGNDPAFPGSTSAHIELAPFQSGAGSNLMRPVLPLAAAPARSTAINALARAYLRGRALVVP